MDTLFALCLEQMESWFRALEKRVPQPYKMPFLHSFVFRYKEKTLEQALIQKLARVVTGLHSARTDCNSPNSRRITTRYILLVLRSIGRWNYGVTPTIS